MTAKKEVLELTPEQKESLALIGDLYREAIYSGKNLPDILDIFISLLTKQDNNMCNTIIGEIIRYKKLVLNRKFLRILRSQINNLYDILTYILPKNISFTIDCRRKSFESTLKKILIYYLSGNSIDLADLVAFRIIIDGPISEEELENFCYLIKDACIDFFVIEKHCTICTPAKQVGSDPLIKNYIEEPKNNKYKSIHLAFKTSNSDNTFEIQIRTILMHDIDETGEAAHFDYKDLKYSSVKDHIYFDINKPHISLFKVFSNGSLYDQIGLKDAFHIEKRSKTF